MPPSLFFKMATIKHCDVSMPSYKTTRIFIRCWFLLLITSCTTTSNKNDDYTINGINPIKPPPLSWQISAKLGISSSQKNGSVTLNWRQTGEEFIIKVQGPLGQGSAIISGTQYNAEIKQPGRQTARSNDVDALVLNTFGWTLPFDNFIHWVVATANPKQIIADIRYDPTLDTLSRLEQSDWLIEYSRYKQVDAWVLPGRIKASHTRQEHINTEEEQTKLTLIIHEWTIL